jgi:DNA polymerase-1
MKKPLLVLFDGNAIVHRAYHAFENTRTLTVSRTGEIVSAVYGFAQMLLKAINDLQPTCYAIAFDRAAPTFRHKLYDQYKAHRPRTPDELVNQMERVKELVDAFKIPVYELDDYEADDVLGALSHQAGEKDIDTIIVTGDADTMQLVSRKVRVLYPRPRGSFSDTALYDEAMVKERYGVGPEQIADLKALVGDPSDNIPGVPGIGSKTAVKLINEFGSIEGIYQHIDEVTPPRIQNIMRENEETARRSKVLATIVIELPVTLDMEACQLKNFDREKVAELFRELEFSSLLPKLPASGELAPEATLPVRLTEPPTRNYHTVDTSEALDELLARLSEARSMAFDVETTSRDPMSAQLVGMSVSPAPGESYYIPVGHVGWGVVEQLPLEHVLERIRRPLEDPALSKLAHNGKYDICVLAGYGVQVNNLAFDTMVAAHLLSEKSVALKALAFNRLGLEMTPITELIGSGAKQVPMSQVEIARVSDYCCADSDVTNQLAELFDGELRKQGLWNLFSEVEMPLIPVLLRMEMNGIALDTELLRQMSHRFGEQLLKLEADIYDCAGHQFNINSPQQLGPILFEELKLPTRRKKGSYTTGAAVLEELRDVHPIIELILQYRQLSKLKSTYIDALPGLIDHKTGRVHTSFNQTRTATGRLSSSDPNLQNIPVRGELGREVRQAFVAEDGSSLLGADYSQIDLRALAHLSRDENLLQAFNWDEDVHNTTAMQLFGVDASDVTSDMRRLAKTVNFGVIYGMSDYGLEQATELSREEASQFIITYFEKYPGVKQYLESTKQQAREKGYVQTMLGRRRSLPEIHSSNYQIRVAAERMAINMPVQGTSADIIKVAMINLQREMEKRGLESKMLIQVHDELLFEVPEKEFEEMSQLVPQMMSTALVLSVPLKVDVQVGRNWGELK